MKKYIYSLLLLLFLMSSCEIEHSNNGKLDGFWHLESIDTLSTGGHTDLSKYRLFWSVQGDLMAFNDYSYKLLPCILQFQYAKDNLTLHHILISDRSKGDIVIKDTKQIKYYGVNSLNESFKIESLNAFDMQLSTKKLRLSFKRF